MVERGAQTNLFAAASLGLMDRVRSYFDAGQPPALDEVNHAFWAACHGGQREAAEYLLDRGADVNWLPPWEDVTPLEAVARSSAGDLVRWLREHGARSAAELTR